MAKLEAVISADTKPFEAALARASVQAGEFGSKLGGIGKDLVTNLSGVDVE